MYKNTRRLHRSAIKHDLSRVKDALSLTAKDVRAKAKDSLENAKDRFRDTSVDLQDSVAKKISDKPFQAIGIAMLSGLILGYAMHHKKKRQRFNSHR